MMGVKKLKISGRKMPPGIIVDEGYVVIRLRQNGKPFKQWIGRLDEPDVADRALAKWHHLKNQQRLGELGIDAAKEHMLLEDASEIFLRLHGLKRESRKGIKQFQRYFRLWKEFWKGRFLDTMTPGDMGDYRRWRKIPRNYVINGKEKTSAANDSTINREQTAFITMFNRLREWRKVGQIPKNTLLPEDNPGRGKDPGQKKVNEDRFIRKRLFRDGEWENLWACSDNRSRRILLAMLNLPLREVDLKSLRKSLIDHKANEFTGVQVKTNREYHLPINEVIWDLIRTAPGDQVLDFAGWDQRWKRIKRRAGLRDLQKRDLRREAATALLEDGYDLREIKEMLGHANVTTTVRYLGLRKEDLQKAGKTLAARYRPPVNSDEESVRKSVRLESENVSIEESEQIENTTNLAG
jgi:integrase